MNNEENNNSLNELYNNSNTQGTNAMDKNIVQPEQSAPTEPVQDVVQQEPIASVPEQPQQTENINASFQQQPINPMQSEPTTITQSTPIENVVTDNINSNIQSQNMVNNQQTTSTNSKKNLFKSNMNNASNDGGLRIAIKQDAKQNIKMGIGGALIVGCIGIFILSLIFGYVLSIIPYGGLLSPIIMIVLSTMLIAGICASGLNNARGNSSGFGATLAWPFKYIKRALCCVVLVLADILGMGLIIFILYKVIGLQFITLILVSLLIIINYAFVYPLLSGIFYLFIDEENNLSVKENIIKGYNLYKDQIMRVLALDVSYIGWMLLAPFTLGILCIWLIPYVACAKGNFYLNIIGQKEFTPSEKGISDNKIYFIYIILMVLSFFLTSMKYKDILYYYNNMNSIFENSSYDDVDYDVGNMKENEVVGEGYKVTFTKPPKYKTSTSSSYDSKYYDRSDEGQQVHIRISSYYTVSGEYSDLDDEYEDYKEDNDYTNVSLSNEKTVFISGKKYKYKVLKYKNKEYGYTGCKVQYSHTLNNKEYEEAYYNVEYEGNKEPTKKDLKFLEIKAAKVK